jgi:hypothetical protein
MLAARPTVLDSDAAPDWNRDPVVVSLARWDRIKDPLGVLDGFLERVLPALRASLSPPGGRRYSHEHFPSQDRAGCLFLRGSV